MKQILSLRKTENSSIFLLQIDKKEADEEFFLDVEKNSDDIYAVCREGQTVALAQMIAGETTFLYVYVFPKYRRRGYGRETVSLLEKELKKKECQKIVTCYDKENPGACTFAAACGYRKEYASDHMIYSGASFPAEELPVRKYRDEDYPEAHAVYAEAFHLMRVSTGCFPDSVPEAESEKMRRLWSETDNERLVYLGEAGEIIGYAHLEGPEISSVSVKPDRQGQGIGRKFVKYIVNELRAQGHNEISLYCVLGNSHARRLYDSLGFQKVCCNEYAVKRSDTAL